MKRIAVLTSGGDAPGMNAAVRAVVRSAAESKCEVYAARDGFAGLIAGDLLRLGPRDVGGIIERGGTFIGTSRCENLKTPSGQSAAVAQLDAHDIQSLVVIGGNGSQTGSHALAQRGVRVVGIASTIDNDLFGADISIGATSALGVAVEAIDRLRVTASSHKRAFLVEVMGRRSGFLALQAAIAGGAEAVVLPEVPTRPEALADEIRESYQRGKRHAIVVVAEGSTYNADAFARYFDEHAERLGFELRVSKLGHIQRGSSPCVFDRLIASRLGVAAVEHLRRGEHGVVLGIIRDRVTATPLELAVGQTKVLDRELIEMARMLAR